MNEGHDDATQAGGNNSAEQFQPEPQVPQSDAQQLGQSQPFQSQPNAAQPDASQSDAPQGIFSSPDLAVNSENLEELKPELSDENKSRIASAFAQTDATQKRDQLSEQMADQDAISGTVLPAGAMNGRFGSNATTSSATGDIRIPGAKKKSKAPLLILIMLVVLAVVGVVVWLMLGNNGEANKPVTALSATEESFAKYANYLLYGEEKTALEGEYDDNHNYTLDQQLESGNYDQNYWDKSETLLRTSFANLRQSESADKELLMDVMNNYLTYFEFLKTYRRIGNVNDEALLMAYISNDMEGVETLLNNYYSAFYSLGSEIATVYADQRKQQYRDVASVYSVYRELGCIVDGVFNEDVCRTATPSVEIQERLAELSAEVSRDTRRADATIENASRYIASYCWDFYDLLKNPNQLKEGSDE